MKVLRPKFTVSRYHPGGHLWSGGSVALLRGHAGPGPGAQHHRHNILSKMEQN